MRQAGILAAAGIVALETMVERLAEDHARARLLAQELANVQGLALDPGTPYTNMIFCSLGEEITLDASQTAAALNKNGVLVGVVGPRRFRIVLHYWINDQAISHTVEAFKSVLEKII